jgi:NAD(P)-dependent dehydrogenase (short-subunit alcohol dehydrogenase family)
MEKLLDNQRIVVAGGTSGIGLALVRMLSEDGATLTAIGRDQQKLQDLSVQLPSVKGVALEARDRSALERLFKAEGPIDHLVLALSGAKGGGAFAGLALSELREGFEAKFWPQLEAVQAALPFMRPGGSITFITAISATAKLPGTAGLAAINGALELMVPILAKELKPLRINAVSPGVIDTAWWDFLPAEAKQQVFSGMSAQVGVGRVGRPEEVAALIRTIIMTEYINGVVIGCHGGLD